MARWFSMSYARADRHLRDDVGYVRGDSSWAHRVKVGSVLGLGIPGYLFRLAEG